MNLLNVQFKQARRDAKMTQTELAEESGVDRVTINRFETGHRDIKVSTLLKLTKTLGLDLTITYGRETGKGY